jgi:hypothetical protein
MLSNNHANGPDENPQTKVTIHPAGSVAEWSIATVLKTVDSQGSVSSNLTASAKSLIKSAFQALFSLPDTTPRKKLRRLDTRVIDQLGNPAIFLRVKRKKQTAHTDLLWLAGQDQADPGRLTISHIDADNRCASGERTN